MTTLSPLDWSLCIGYLVVVFLLGLWFARGQKTNEDYFLGGRKMHWVPIGLSIFAGTFSSLSFVGLPSTGAYKDYHLYLAILFIPFVVTPIVWTVFLPLYYRLGITTAYEYVERRFDRRLRLACSVLFMLYTIGWMGNMLSAVGVILQAVFEISKSETAMLLIGVGVFATVYTAAGGVKAVVWTDALQAFALGGGMLVVLFLTLAKVDGGWSGVQENANFEMFNASFDAPNGNLWAACAFGLFVYLTGHSVSFGTVQRFMSMPSLQAARRSLLVNGLMVGLTCGLFFIVGSTLRSYYLQNPNADVKTTVETENLSSDHAAAALADGSLSRKDYFETLNRNKNGDQLLPRFVMKELALPGLMGLLLAGLFAAVMSSIDSGINSMTASVMCDWQTGKELQVGQSRMLCSIFGIAAVAVAMYLFYEGGDVFPVIMEIAGMFFGMMLAVFLLGMFLPIANTQGVLCGLGAGCIALALTKYVTARFGWSDSHWWAGALTCMPTLIVGGVASVFFPKPDSAQTEGLMVRSRTPRTDAS